MRAIPAFVLQLRGHDLEFAKVLLEPVWFDGEVSAEFVAAAEELFVGVNCGWDQLAVWQIRAVELMGSPILLLADSSLLRLSRGDQGSDCGAGLTQYRRLLHGEHLLQSWHLSFSKQPLEMKQYIRNEVSSIVGGISASPNTHHYLGCLPVYFSEEVQGRMGGGRFYA